MLFNRTEKYALLLFVGLSAAAFVHAQSIEDNLAPVEQNPCLSRCEQYRQECNASAQGDATARQQCESTVTTPCVTACNEGRTFTPPPYPTPQPSCTQDTWICGEWTVCSEAGAQTRDCRLEEDCASVETAQPALSQSCTPPPPPPTAPTDPADEPQEDEPVNDREETPPPQPTRPVTPPPADDDSGSGSGSSGTGSPNEPAPSPAPTEPEPDAPTEPPPTDETPDTDDGSPSETTPTRSGSGGGGSSAAQQAASECTAAGLTTQECYELLVRGFGLEDCASAGYVTRESCEEYLTTRNGGTFPGCETATPERCEAIKKVLLVRYITDDNKDVADKLLQSMIERDVVEPIEGLTSISDARVKDAAWWRATGDVETSSGVVVIDSDRDGLPDDFERQLGLNPNDADSDDDGVDDAEEMRRGTANLGPTARAIVNGATFSQPHGDGDTDPDLIAKLDEGGKLYGFCDPNATCLVFVYSYIPTVFTVQANANGEWTYDLGDQLSEGSHIAYVAVSDEGGAVDRKSNPLSFFVTEAQAVTDDPNAYLGAAPIVAAQQQNDPTTLWYVLGTVAAVLAAGGAAFAVLRPKAVTMK